MNKNIKCIVAVNQVKPPHNKTQEPMYKACEQKPTWIQPNYFESTGKDAGYCGFHMEEKIRWLGKYADSHKTKEGYYNLHNRIWMPLDKIKENME